MASLFIAFFYFLNAKIFRIPIAVIEILYIMNIHNIVSYKSGGLFHGYYHKQFKREAYL